MLLSLACAEGSARVAPREAVTQQGALADSIALARQDSVNRAHPGYVIDSLFTPEEELRRFTADIPVPPRALSHGADSRDALVQKWALALEERDSLTLIRLAVNRPEFAFLIYPGSPLSRSPYRQPPATAWMHLSNGSVQGFRRSLSALGGQSLAMIAYECPGALERQGANRIWSDCRVRRVRAPGDTVIQKLFGPIVERDGRFKFLTLVNDL